MFSSSIFLSALATSSRTSYEGVRPTDVGPCGSQSRPSVLRLSDPPDMSRSAPELRATSTSMALHRGVAVPELLSAVGWASGCTFATFYMRHLGLADRSALTASISLPSATPLYREVVLILLLYTCNVNFIQLVTILQSSPNFGACSLISLFVL